MIEALGAVRSDGQARRLPAPAGFTATKLNATAWACATGPAKPGMAQPPAVPPWSAKLLAEPTTWKVRVSPAVRALASAKRVSAMRQGATLLNTRRWAIVWPRAAPGAAAAASANVQGSRRQ